MALFLKQSDFRIVIRRKTPCLICIEDNTDVKNYEIIKSINNLCHEFPFVLCYKITIHDYKKYHLNKSTYGPNNLIRFESENITSIADGNNYLEMYKLFWQVYYDACAKNFEGYLLVLYAEKFLVRHKKPIYDIQDLNFIDDLVGEKLSKYLENKKSDFCKSVFKSRKFSVKRVSKKDPYYLPKKKSLTNVINNYNLHSLESQYLKKDKYDSKRNIRKIKIYSNVNESINKSKKSKEKNKSI